MTTTSDKELLELAAKATGLTFKEANWFAWNPLTDDGDALRLAVKLHLLESSWLGDMSKEADPYAATRRAIVRAAAEIGESM